MSLGANHGFATEVTYNPNVEGSELATSGAAPAPPADVTEAIKNAKADWLKRKVAYTSAPLTKGEAWAKAYREHSVADVLASIAKPPKARAEAVAVIRSHDDGTDEQEAAKKKLPSVVFAGRIEGDQRTEANFVGHTGLAFFDYEFDKNADAAATMRDELFADEHIAAAWVSSSGKGVHALARFETPPKNNAEHKASYKAAVKSMSERAQGTFDSTSDRTRLTFLPHDPDLRFRQESTAFPIVTEEQAKQTAKRNAQPRRSAKAPTVPVAERVAHAMQAIEEGLVGGPYKAGANTYTEASTMTWAMSQYVDGNEGVMNAWLNRLDADGRFDGEQARRNFEAKWRGEGKFNDITAGTFVHRVREESKRLGKKSPIPQKRLRMGFVPAWLLYCESEDEAEKQAALEVMRQRADEGMKELEAILELERATIDDIHESTAHELDALANVLGNAGEKGDEKADIEYDKLLVARQANIAKARKAAVAELSKLRQEVVAHRTAAIKVLMSGDDPIPKHKARKVVGRLWPKRLKELDVAIKQAVFMGPSQIDEVAGALDVNGGLERLWAEDEAAAHTGSTWSQFAGETPKVQWVIEWWLAKGMVTILAGEPGLGKSRFTQQLALAISLRKGVWAEEVLQSDHKGRALLPERGKRPFITVMANAEDTQGMIADNARKFAKDMGVATVPTEDDMHDGRGLGPVVAQAMHRIDFFNPQGNVWAPTGAGSRHIETEAGLTSMGKALRAHCEQINAGLLILDPLANLYGSSENTRAHVAAFMRSWNAWAQRTGIAVLIIAHPPKSGDAFSGSTSWVGAARCAISMSMVWVIKKPADEKNNQPEKLMSLGERKPSADDFKKNAPREVPRIEVVKSNHAKYKAYRWLDLSGGAVKATTLAGAYEAAGGAAPAKADNKQDTTERDPDMDTFA